MEWVSGDPFWIKHTKIPTQFPYLTEDLTTEVVVVGGGITGALTAYYFAKAGVKTVLIDKNIIAYNSTAATPSILRYEIDHAFTGLKKMYNEQDAATVFQLQFQAVQEMKSLSEKMEADCGWAEKPCLYFSNSNRDKKHFQQEFQLRKKYGFPVEWLDEENADAKFPLPIKAGILSTGGSAVMDPYRFTHGLLQLAIRYGLQVYEHTKIVNRTPEKDHIRLQTDSHFQIKAQKVIFATGYEAQNHITEKIARFTRTFCIVTRPHFDIDGWYEQSIIRDHATPCTYMRSLPDQRILIGGYDNQKDKTASLADDPAQIEQAYQTLLETFTTWFPSAAIIPNDIEYQFNSIFATTKDSLPYIGECEEMPQCYLNLGYGTNGILYALLGAKIILEMYQGKSVSEAQLFRFGR
jgi:glycine/D-amino acid oxidase-like deaminating enzyme